MEKKRIKDLATSITAFRTGDVIVVDGPTSTAKMSKDDLLKETAQNALAGNMAPVFDPTRTSENPYKVGESVTYNGKVYTFKVNHYGNWNVDHVERFNFFACDEKLNYDFLDGGVADFDGTTDGQGVRTDFNTPYYSENLSCSDYILCFGAKKIAFLDMINTTSGGVIGYAFYDKGKKVITGAERSHGDAQGAVERVVNVPKGAYYFRSTYWSSAKVSELGLAHYYCNVDYSGLTDLGLFEKVIENRKVITLETVKASDASILSNKIVNCLNGNYEFSDTHDSCTIDIAPYAQFVKLPLTSRYDAADKRTGIAFLDDDGNFITGHGTNRMSSSSAAVLSYIIPIPNGAKKIRVSLYKQLDLSTTYFEFYRVASGFEKTTTIRYSSENSCDGYWYNIQDNVLSNWSNNFGMFEKLPCDGAIKIVAKIPIYTTDAQNGIVFYGENGVISCIYRLKGESSSENIELLVPAGAKYVSVLSWNYDKWGTYGEPYVDVIYAGEIGCGKRQYKPGQIHFSVIVDQSVADWWSGESVEDPILKRSTCVLTLPNDYTREGKPSKLMIWCHGNSRNVSLAQWGLNDADYLAQKERFRAAGYAVLDCNGPRDNSGNSISYAGCPQGVMAYLKAIKFAVENYNLDSVPYIIGSSAGGLTASSLAAIIPSKCLCYLSPNLSHYSWWVNNGRGVFVDWFGFDDTVTWEQDKAVGWDAKSKIVNDAIQAFFPRVMLYVGDAEIDGPFWQDMLDVISAIRAGGGYAGLHICENADHGITNGQFPAVDQQVINWLNRF